jgi:hypothetical protein
VFATLLLSSVWPSDLYFCCRLDSPHYSLWSSVQSSMARPGLDRHAPPTPTSLLGGLSGGLGDDRHRLWGSGIANDAHLFSATSQVMQMSSSPLLGGDYFLQGNKKGPKSKKLGRRSPADDILEADDSNDTYDGVVGKNGKKGISQLLGSNAMMTAGQGVGRGTGRKKKQYVTPDTSLEASSVADLLSLGSGSVSGSGGGRMLSPTEAASSVEKLSISVKSQKFGLASVSKAGSAVGNSGGRRLKSQHSQLENYDLSQYFGGRQVPEEAQGEDSNNSLKSGSTVAAVAGEVTVCNCKKSKCLKLYCDCFAVMNYCSAGCNCFDCCNRTDREAIRQDAIKCTKERNAMAFQTKINNKDQHSTGCHCKNSQCLKKYCECYTGGAFCGTNCKCQMCLNFNGSADLIKARSAMKDEGSSHSRKRKESPSSVAFLDNNTPPGLNSGSKSAALSVHAKEGAQSISFSPELRTSANGAPAAMPVGRAPVSSAMGHVPMMSASRGPTIVTPGSGATQQAYLATPTQGAVDPAMHHMAKRSKTQPTPATAADRQLRSRKLNGEDDDSAHATGASLTSSALVRAGEPAKKRQVKFAPIPIVYPFFGSHLPATSKLIALKCLDFLEGKDIYAMSQVNTLWCAAAMDDALWE